MDRKSVLAIWLGCLIAVLLLAVPAQASTTVSSSPAIGATGVATSTPLIFTFSSSMNPLYVSVLCSNLTAGTIFLLPTGVWSSGDTVLTYTPSSGFPGDSLIAWYVFGVDASFQPLAGATSGTFTTGTGTGSTGSGTNAVTTFAVSKVNWWDQSSTASPVPDASIPYYFAGTTTLASNRTATSITLTMPTAAVSNLTQNFVHPESYYLISPVTSSNAFEAAFPQGTYTFYVSATASNQTVPVLLPTGMTQPNPPHITNYVAAQSLNATQAFTLGWDAFVGGTSTDYVYVVIGNDVTNVWNSPDPGAAGALNGTATSVTIPANSLQANSNYTNSFVGFYHAIVNSNAAYVTTAFRATATWFNVRTVSTVGAAPPVLTNAVWSSGSFGFDVVTTAGQTLTVVSTTNCALPLAQWPTLLTTNSPGARVHITDPRPATGWATAYRVRNGT
jgi:hypothetical protein